MKLVIVRHADAGDREEFAKTGKPDELRPLSDKGRKQMQSAAEGLHTLVPKGDLIATSPLTRAVQTAKIVAAEYKGAKQETTEALEPESAPEDFESWIRDHSNADTVIIVGHEPHLGELTTWLMTGAPSSHVEFKKGGACLLAFDAEAKKGAGVLQWLLGPKELRALGSA